MARITVSAAAPHRLDRVQASRWTNRLKAPQRMNPTKEQNAKKNRDGQSHEYFKDDFSATSQSNSASLFHRASMVQFHD
jgi:hypothetical protein